MTEVVQRLTASLADRYRIERELGQGGMATVYLAHDIRHDRKVALKVLRPELAAILGAERFLAEIRTTANLQHPHILPLHDSGASDGTVYYVMPYVEGESLRDRLNREKQLPVDDAVRIASEVAAALDYAHRHSVIHRDIKPENILLQDGSALVADFGIALAVSTAGGGTRMTETGMSLGTPHYMAPEQAMGEREITARADIYALGCVVYEMLTAEPPFDGATAQAIVARVMTEQPRSLTLQRHTIPPHVEAAVQKALEKLPADRFASAAAFADALNRPGAIPLTAVHPGPLYQRAARAPVVLALALVALVATGVAAWALLQKPTKRVDRFGLLLPGNQAPVPFLQFALSQDGSRLLYRGPSERALPPRLWLKVADRYGAEPIPGTEGVSAAVFSPDGEWIAYVQARQLKKVRVSGGAATTLAQDATVSPTMLAWLDDHTIVYAEAGARTFRQIPEDGGTARVAWQDTLRPYQGMSAIPGGHAILVAQFQGVAGFSLFALDLRDSTLHLVQNGAVRGWWTPKHVAYVRADGAMFAIPFDFGALKPTGAPVPVMDSVALSGTTPLMDISFDGTLAVRTGSVAGPSQRHRFVWVDMSGRETQVDTGFVFTHPVFGANAGWSLSPDGRRVALGMNTDAGDNIWVKQLPDGPAVRVTFDTASEYRPRWTPDGRAVLFASNRVNTSGLRGLFVRPADGTGRDSLVLAGNFFEGQLSNDGQWLLARAGGTVNQGGSRNIGALRIGTDTALVPLVATQFDESEIALSPDSRWLAYVSDETGRPEVFIRPFPATESAKYQVSTTGGVAPLWSRDGRQLFFLDGARRMTAVSVAPGAALRLGDRRPLFAFDDNLYLTEREWYTPYDIAPDGRRFLMARRLRSNADDPLAETPLIITRNWFEELRARGR